MKRLVSKVQQLGDKAKQIQQAIQSVPPKIAEISESVALTTSQLQQLRANVQASAASLRVEDSDRMIDVLDEINGAAEVFEQAGYTLRGVDMELSPAQRLIVHLDKVEDVSHATIRGLVNANQNNRTVHALLTSLLQAEGVVDRVTLNHLEYRTLIVHLGPVPIVRLCWRGEEEFEQVLPVAASPSVTPAAASTSTLASSPAPGTSAFSQSSYFEQRAPQPPPVPGTVATTVTPQPPAPAEPTPGHPHTATAEPAHATTAPGAPAVDWKREALDRFKKMPNVSKYRR